MSIKHCGGRSGYCFVVVVSVSSCLQPSLTATGAVGLALPAPFLLTTPCKSSQHSAAGAELPQWALQVGGARTSHRWSLQPDAGERTGSPAREKGLLRATQQGGTGGSHLCFWGQSPPSPGYHMAPRTARTLWQSWPTAALTTFSDTFRPEHPSFPAHCPTSSLGARSCRADPTPSVSLYTDLILCTLCQECPPLPCLLQEALLAGPPEPGWPPGCLPDPQSCELTPPWAGAKEAFRRGVKLCGRAEARGDSWKLLQLWAWEADALAKCWEGAPARDDIIPPAQPRGHSRAGELLALRLQWSQLWLLLTSGSSGHGSGSR